MIPNEKLLAVAQDAGFFESFRVADDILRQAVQGISDIITIPGHHQPRLRRREGDHGRAWVTR